MPSVLLAGAYVVHEYLQEKKEAEKKTETVAAVADRIRGNLEKREPMNNRLSDCIGTILEGYYKI